MTVMLRRRGTGESGGRAALRRRAAASVLAFALVVPVDLIATAGDSGSTGPSAGVPSSGAPEAGTVQVLSVRAPGGTAFRRIWVYRPAVPDSADVPVLYFLHGVPGDGKGVMAALRGSMDAAMQSGAPPFVLVAPDGWGENHGDTEWADAADGSDEIETLLLQVVIPAVEGTHVRDRAHRAIAGFSMGGYGAMNIALRHPDLFGSVASISGYFHIDDPDGMFANSAVVQDANDPALHVAAARGMHIMLVEDVNDPLLVVRGEAARFESLLKAAAIPATLSIVPGSHSLGFAATQFPAITGFLEASWAGAMVRPAMLRP